MVAWEEQHALPSIFGEAFISNRFGPVEQMPSFAEALTGGQQVAQSAWGSYGQSVTSSTSQWASRNTLDPFIHQAIAHFIRAQQLRAHGFDLEAFVAFDCVVQSVALFLSERGRKTPLRRDVCAAQGLSTEMGNIADYAYFVRNNFGAHPKGWRWWDVQEMTEHEIDFASVAALEILRAAAELEGVSRRIEPNPEDWGSWLFDNFEMLWDAVWFREIE